VHARIAFILFVATATSLPTTATAGPQAESAKTAFLEGAPAPVPPAVVSRDDEGHVTIRAIRLTERLVVDGRLDDRLYTENQPFGDFIEQASSSSTSRRRKRRAAPATI